MSSTLQRHIQNSIKNLRWSTLRKNLTPSTRWLSLQSTPCLNKLLDKLVDYLSCMRMFDICQTDYSIHCNHLISYFFYLSFILWIPVYQKISVIKQCWHVLFFAPTRLVLSVLECNRPIACIKWRRFIKRRWEGVSKGNQSINQSKTIYFTVHKWMIENLLDNLGNKVVFVQMER